jgi:hypothetical protein
LCKSEKSGAGLPWRNYKADPSEFGVGIACPCSGPEVVSKKLYLANSKSHRQESLQQSAAVMFRNPKLKGLPLVVMHSLTTEIETLESAERGKRACA